MFCLSANQYTGIELVEPLKIPWQGLLSIAENIHFKGCCITQVCVPFVLDLTATKILEGRAALQNQISMCCWLFEVALSFVSSSLCVFVFSGYCFAFRGILHLLLTAVLDCLTPRGKEKEWKLWQSRDPDLINAGNDDECAPESQWSIPWPRQPAGQSLVWSAFWNMEETSASQDFYRDLKEAQQFSGHLPHLHAFKNMPLSNKRGG